jgi:hypothetical protein
MTYFNNINTVFGDHPAVKSMHQAAIATAKSIGVEAFKPTTELHLVKTEDFWDCGIPEADDIKWPGRFVFTFPLRSGMSLEQLLGKTESKALTVTIPTAILVKPTERECRYVLYRIGFEVSRREDRLDDEATKPLFAGYYGITKRGALTRYLEHVSKAKQNSGSLLHSVWNGLLCNELLVSPQLHICGVAATLKEIYKMEELTVQKETLTPLGLNAIPGGEEGIKMLHELALLKGRKVGIDERDAAVERLQQESPCAHYRRGHMRKLPTDKLTFVRPCWVNVK